MEKVEGEIVENTPFIKRVPETSFIDGNFREISEVATNDENETYYGEDLEDDYDQNVDYNDIPEVREKKNIFSFFDRFKKKKKTEFVELKEDELEEISEVEESVENEFDDIPEVKEKITCANTRYIKSVISCLVSGGLTCAAIAGTLITAASVLTIGVIPALLTASCFVAATMLSSFLFKLDKEKFNRVSRETLFERKQAKLERKSQKKSRFSKIKSIFKKHKNEVVEELENDEIIEEPITEEIETNVNENPEEKIIKTKFTREQKMGKIKECGKFGHIKGLGIYCIALPKEEKTLEKFAKQEYKKEYPEDKIQSFETENEKVLVLKNEPTMFRK